MPISNDSIIIAIKTQAKEHILMTAIIFHTLKNNTLTKNVPASIFLALAVEN
jgi:hypothetical protein